MRWFQSAWQNVQVIDATLRSFQIGAVAAVAVDHLCYHGRAPPPRATAPYPGLTSRYAAINSRDGARDRHRVAAADLLSRAIKIFTGYSGIGYLIARIRRSASRSLSADPARLENMDLTLERPPPISMRRRGRLFGVSTARFVAGILAG